MKSDASCVDGPSLHHTAHTTISIKIRVSSDTNEHSGRVSLTCGSRQVRDDSGTDVGFDESWSWRCLLRVERTVSQCRTSGCQWSNLADGTLSSKSWYFICSHRRWSDSCVPDDVFMITLIKHWRKKRCSTHRNSSRQLWKISRRWSPRNIFVHWHVVQ